jgi:hypothetical protein
VCFNEDEGLPGVDRRLLPCRHHQHRLLIIRLVNLICHPLSHLLLPAPRSQLLLSARTLLALLPTSRPSESSPAMRYATTNPSAPVCHQQSPYIEPTATQPTFRHPVAYIFGSNLSKVPDKQWPRLCENLTIQPTRRMQRRRRIKILERARSQRTSRW